MTRFIQRRLGQQLRTANEDMNSELQSQGRLCRVCVDVSTVTDRTRAMKDTLQAEVQSVDATEPFRAWLQARAATTGDHPRLGFVGVNSLILLDALSESSAVEDALYELDRGLNDRTVDQDHFLREVRRLTNCQFSRKAHVTRVHAHWQI